MVCMLELPAWAHARELAAGVIRTHAAAAVVIIIAAGDLNARTRDGISFRLAQLPEKSGTGDYPIIY